jgi:hypothetical protein
VHSTDVVGLSANLARDTFRCVTRRIIVVTSSISWGYNNLTSFFCACKGQSVCVLDKAQLSGHWSRFCIV